MFKKTKIELSEEFAFILLAFTFIFYILVVFLLPYISFWAIKILFNFDIPYTFKTILAFWVLKLALVGKIL